MSTRAGPRRLRSWAIQLLWMAGGIALLYLISHVTGFGDWLNGTPAAIATVRVIAILLFGACGVAMLLVDDEGEEPRRLRDWFYAAAAFVLALANAVLLIGGEDTF